MQIVPIPFGESEKLNTKIPSENITENLKVCVTVLEHICIQYQTINSFIEGRTDKTT